MATANQGEPIVQLREHLRQAMDAGDLNASYAALITIDAEGAPVSRMVTVREVTASTVSLTINSESPKAQHLRKNGQWELLYFLPSRMIQYRLRGIASFVNDEALEEQWLQKSSPGRLVDVYHATTRNQSTVLPDRQTLLHEISALEQRQVPLRKPSTVINLVLTPTQVEQWIGSLSDRLHDRRLYRWDDEVWQMETLVP